MDDYQWNQRTAGTVCRHLNCGSLVSEKETNLGFEPSSNLQPVWLIRSSCESHDASLRECILKFDSMSVNRIEVICSDDKQ